MQGPAENQRPGTDQGPSPAGSPSDRREPIVSGYYAAMRRGADAAADLFALFAADAEYSEPFTGLDPAVGIEAIRERFSMMWEHPLPEMELDVLTVSIDGDRATATWECRSPGLPGPQRGTDVYHLADGRIVRLEVKLLDTSVDD